MEALELHLESFSRSWVCLNAWISFRIFGGFCNSQVDFKSLRLILVVLGGLWGAFFQSRAAFGAPGAPFWGHFGGLGVLWGSILGVWGCSWAPSARNGLQRPVVPFSGAPL